MCKNIFDELKTKYVWRPMSGCPGRYIFAPGIVALTIQQLTDSIIEISEEGMNRKMVMLKGKHSS